MAAPNRPLTRNSSLSDADLSADGRRTLLALRRDQPALADDGVSPARLDALAQALQTFDALPSDVVSEAAQTLETTARDQALAALQAAIRRVAGPVADAYGTTSGQYRSLHVLDLANLNDAESLKAATDCVAGGQRLLADPRVTQEGLSQARLDAVGPARQALVDALDRRTAGELDRALAAQDRVRQHNALNNEITTLQAKGQRRFRAADPARYADYVRQPAPGSPGPTPPPAPAA